MLMRIISTFDSADYTVEVKEELISRQGQPDL